MRGPLFKFYIREIVLGVTYYWYLNSSGVPTTSTTKTAIEYSPLGWMDIKISWERGFAYHGVFTNYTTPLKFTRDGAKLLRYFYYQRGVEAQIQLLVEKHTNTIATWGYATYFIGDLDFSRFSDMKNFANIEIMEGGFMAKLKAKETTDIEIPVEQNPDVIFVKMDGIDLQATTNWAGIPNEEIKNSLGANIPSFVNYLTKGTNLFMSFKDQILAVSDYFRIMTNHSNTVTQDVDLTYKYYYNIFIDGGASAAYFTLLYEIVDDSTNTIVNEVLAYQTGTILSAGSSATYVGTATNTISIPPKHSVVTTIRMFLSTGTAGSQLFPSAYEATQLGSDIYLTLLNRVPTSYIPCISPNVVFQAISDDIESGNTIAANPIDANEGYLLTCGDAIRNLSNSVLKTNFQDFYNAINAMLNTAFYYNKALLQPTINYKANVYTTGSVVIDLGEVAKMDIAPLTSEMFSKLKIGYKDYSYDDYNGKEEFNTEYIFQSDLTRVTTEKDLTSQYRADMYGIELTRANLTDKLLADDSSDNDVFWINADLAAGVAGTIPAGYPNAGADYYDLYRDTGLTITGLISPATAFNINFSPKRRMFEHINWLKSLLYPLYGNLTFKSSSKTTDTGIGLSTDDAGYVITEKLTENVSTLGGTVTIKPLIFTIETKIPSNIMDLLTSPYKHLSFTYNRNTYYGFLLEVHDEPAFIPKQTYKLICSPSTDLTQLIV